MDRKAIEVNWAKQVRPVPRDLQDLQACLATEAKADYPAQRVHQALLGAPVTEVRIHLSASAAIRKRFSLNEICQQYRLALYCRLIVIIQVNRAYRDNLEVRAK